MIGGPPDPPDDFYDRFDGHVPPRGRHSKAGKDPKGPTDWLARLAEMVELVRLVKAGPTAKIERGALVSAFMADRGLMASMALEWLENEDGVKSVLNDLGALPGMRNQVADLRSSFKRGAKEERQRRQRADRERAKEETEASAAAENPKHHDPAAPIIAIYPCANAMWVRARDGHYVLADQRMLRKELNGHQPEVELWEPENERGKRPPITAGVLMERYGRRVDKLFYDMTRDDTRYEPGRNDGGELHLSATARPPIAPVFDEEVDTWLRLLFGERADIGLDWLATIGVLSEPTAAIYLQGPKSSGKGLLYESCAKSFGGSSTTYNDIAGSGFNSAMKESPIVILNERVNDKAAKAGTGFFRDFIGGSAHALLEKNKPAATLIGCPRMIITANNADALRIRERLTPEDEDAVGERIIHIDIGPEAAAYLKALGGRPYTRDWVRHHVTGAAGEVPQHIAWLEANREVVWGERYVVHGDAEEWLKKSTKRGGLKQEILVVLAKLCSGEGPIHPNSKPAYRRGECVAVSPTRLERCWRDITGGSTAKLSGGFGKELKALSSNKSCRVGPRGSRMPGWLVPISLVVDVAIEMGVGDVAAICEAYELKVPEGFEVDGEGSTYDDIPTNMGEI